MPLTPETWKDTVSLGGWYDIIELADGRMLASYYTSNNELRGQLFDQLGNKTGGTFQLNTLWTSDNQENPSLAALPDGGWIVAFEDAFSSGSAIRMETYNSSGIRVDNDSVAAFSNTTFRNPIVEVSSATSALVTYYEANSGGFSAEYGTFFRAYNPATGTLSTAVEAFALLGDKDIPVDTVVLANGNYVIAVESYDQSLHFGGEARDTYISYMIVSETGSYVRIPTLLVSETDQRAGTNVVDRRVDNAAISSLDDGGFVMAWVERNVDNSGITVIKHQLFNSAGVQVGGRKTIEAGAAGNENDIMLTNLDDGGYILSFDYVDQHYGRRFDSSGNAVGSQFVIGSDLPLNFDPTATLITLSDGRIASLTSDGLKIHDTRDSVTQNTASGDYIGTVGNDIVRNFTNDGYGWDGDDLLIQRTAGNDLYGGNGNDELRHDGAIVAGSPTLLDGGDGTDTFVTGGALADWTVDLSAGTITSDAINFDNLSSIENVTSGGGDDTLIGDSEANTLNGNSGDDIIYGGSGKDTLNGGFGKDSMQGDGGSDTLNGGGGNDRLFQNMDGSNTNTLNGGNDTDTWILGAIGGGFSGTDWTINLTTGNSSGGSTIVLTTSIENIESGNGDDDITGNASNNVVTGNNGEDWIRGEAGDDVLSGGNHDDRVEGGDDNDILSGGDGRDILLGGEGNDELNGNSGDDNLQGGDGNDIITDTEGANSASGGAGNDTITLGAGDDTASGNDGNDIINSGGGDDTVFAGNGNDLIDAGAGNDNVFASVSGISESDMFDGGADFDILSLSDDGWSVLLGTYFASSGSTFLNFSNFEEIRTGNGDDSVFEAGQATRVLTQNGDDTVIAETGLVYINLGNDDDRLILNELGFSESLGQQLIGGSGSDTLVLQNYLVQAGDRVDLQNIVIDIAGQLEVSFSSFENYDGRGNLSGSQETVYGNNSDNLLQTGGGNDFLSGGNGNDRLESGSGNDTLEGGDGEDELYGGFGSDTLIGGNGNDYLNGNTGIDSFDGGAGTDIVDYSYSNSNYTVDLQAETGRLTSSSTTESLVSIESLIMGDGDDTITGSSDANSITLGGGNDWVDAGLGNDILEGGAGVDTLSYATQSLGFNINLTTGKTTSAADAGYLDEITDFENIEGSSGHDILVGNSSDNILEGGDGDDQMTGNGGVDTADYSRASSGVTVSLLVSSAQNTGGAGTDTLSGIENLTGSDFDDVLIGGNGANTLLGGAGDDTISGGFSLDYLDGGTGNDTLDFTYSSGDLVANLLLGNVSTVGTTGPGETVYNFENIRLGNGDHIVTGSDIANIIETGSGDDAIDAGGGADTVIAGAGQNIINGGNGNDTFIVQSGTDDIDGGIGTDTVDFTASTARVRINFNSGQGTEGDAAGDTYTDIERALGTDFNDILVAGGAITQLRGGLGNDILRSGAGDEDLRGDEGDDTIYGGAGADDIRGGSGLDTVSYRYSNGGVTIDLEDLTLNTGDAAGDTYSLIERVNGTDHNDIIRGRDGSQDRLFGSDGDDVLVGRAGNDFLFGGDGADHHDGGTGFDYASYFNASVGVTVDLVDGTLNTGEAAGDTFTSIERFYGSLFDDNFAGDSSDNFIRSFGGDDILDGRSGNDRLYGEDGNDTISGGAGIDRLYGGVGDDILTGGTERDLYYFGANNGSDTITDFENNTDRMIFFDNAGADSFADLTIVQDNTDVLITYTEGDIRLLNTNISDIDAGDFGFF